MKTLLALVEGVHRTDDNIEESTGHRMIACWKRRRGISSSCQLLASAIAAARFVGFVGLEVGGEIKLNASVSLRISIVTFVT